MPTLKVTPARLHVGDEYRVIGDGFLDGEELKNATGQAVGRGYVHVSITYLHRAEATKALVSDGKIGDHPAGRIDLTLRAEEAGEPTVTIRDDSQRRVLAEATFKVGE